ncbi:MAG TPA: PspC domain-containing protein [Actinospica sp.]|jgi:phage shock protein PspC (stress-responsive transcriptional regulator)|nr:PspC domain-containing protein [Actinospica sp.]
MSDQTTPGRMNREPLRRDRRSKVIAGVCGGLGRHLDIDPVVFRILFAVLSFVGGIGLLAYAAAWLFVPVDGERKSAAHRMLTGSNPLLAVIVAVGLALGALASISALTNGISAEWPLLMIAAAVLGVLIWRGDVKVGRNESTRTSRQPPTWWQQPVGEAPEGAPGAADGGAGEAGEPRDAAPAGFAAYAAPGTEGGGASGAWVDLAGLHGGSGAPAEAAFAEPAGRPKRRGYGGLVFASLLAATGVVGVLDAARLISLTWLSGGALVLVLLGAGMTIGGMFGKTTALVPIGLVVAVPLLVLAIADVPLHGTVGNADWAPVSAAALQSSYKVGVGGGTVDLTRVAPGAGRTLAVDAEVGIGDLRVQVPSDVTVQVHAHTGLGDIETDGPAVAGTTSDGVGRRTEDFTIPAQGTSQGTLVLDLTIGIGRIIVEGPGN